VPSDLKIAQMVDGLRNGATIQFKQGKPPVNAGSP
jgi:hypothetical protein